MTVDDDDDVRLDPAYFDVDDGERSGPRPQRRRRPRMGQVVDSLGKRATASPKPAKLAKVIERREHIEKAKAISSGGSNKGEERGFGVTSRRRSLDDDKPVTLDNDGGAG